MVNSVTMPCMAWGGPDGSSVDSGVAPTGVLPVEVRFALTMRRPGSGLRSDETVHLRVRLDAGVARGRRLTAGRFREHHPSPRGLNHTRYHNVGGLADERSAAVDHPTR